MSLASCTIPNTRAPMCTAALRLAFCAYPVKNRGSRAEHAKSGPSTGRSSSPGIIPVTSPGTSSSGTSGGLMTTGHCPTRIAAGPREKDSPYSRGSFDVDDAGGGCPSGISIALRYHHMSVIRSTLVLRERPASRSVVMRLTQRSRDALLEAMQPAQLEISMAAFDQVAARARQLDRQWQLTLERARYEAELARRRFVAVEPENRLVARTLEREWNEKLAEIERMERDETLRPQLASRLVDPEERRRVLALAQDVSKVWHSPTTPQSARKQLLGYLIKDVTLTRGETIIQVAIRWQTEACTVLEVPRPSALTKCAELIRRSLLESKFWRWSTPIGRLPPCWTRRVSGQAPEVDSLRTSSHNLDMVIQSKVAVPRHRRRATGITGPTDDVPRRPPRKCSM